MRFTRQYMAGLFDGEGCVSISQRRRVWKGVTHIQVSLRCFIVNTNIELIKELKKCFGGNVSTTPHEVLQWKTSGQWRLNSDQAIKFLKWIFPATYIKRKQIQLAIDFHKFQKLPMSKRCTLVPRPLPKSPNLKVWKKTDMTLKVEDAYKNRLHELNRKGLEKVVPLRMHMRTAGGEIV